MSWHCLQEREAAFSAESYLAGIASERLKSRNTRVESCSPANVTDSFQSSPSGMTCGHLTESPGAALSMSSAAASHAKTYPQQERESESTVSAADSGLRCTESFARFDHASHSWKTPQCSLLEGLDEFSETWPKSGMMRAGRAYPLPTAARPTAGNESGYLHMIPTPTVEDASRKGSAEAWEKYKNAGFTPGARLRNYVQEFPTCPTPQATDYKRMKYTPETLAKRKNHQQGLPEMVYSKEFKILPTPTCQDAKNNGGKSQQERNTKPLNAVVGGALNPDWVEWLMGWPIGWTALKPLAMDKYQLWRQQHSESSIAN